MNPDGIGIVSLTPRAFHAIHPHWAPDSRSVVYCTTDDLDPPRKNEADVYRIDVASRQVTKLIGGGINTYPSLSPDGKRLTTARSSTAGIPRSMSPMPTARMNGT